MPQAPGRNTKLENAWRQITTFFNRTANTPTGQTAPLVGQVGAFSSASFLSRRYDQEYLEIPVRDAYRARALIELRKRSEVSTALDILVGDIFSSEDGDDLGFTIGETLNDAKTPVDPKILEIGLALIDRTMRGTVLNTVVEEFLIYGDSFRSLMLSPDYSQILKIKHLPPWEMFRVEDENGMVERYEQRRMLSTTDPEYEIHPAICTHWRYRQLYKYGRSLFEEIIEDSNALEQGYFAVDKAAMAIGVNPNVHTMPEGWKKDQCDAYKISYENERDRSGRIMTDFFVLAGGDIKKLSQSWNPDLKALIDNVMQRRMRIAMRSRIPPWMIGLPSQGARDIAGQPALAYARFIGSIRLILTEGLREIINLELALNGMKKDQMQYRIVFPKIYTNTTQQSGIDPGESNLQGIENLDRLLSNTARDRYSTFNLGN
jgi:hypothetical protein